jgi:plastocyanin
VSDATRPRRPSALLVCAASLAGLCAGILSPKPGTASLVGRIELRDRGDDGKFSPAPDQQGTVIYVVGYEEPLHLDGGHVATAPSLDQNGRTFNPNLVAVQKGGEVVFENSDGVMHNIFSNDPKFDLGQFKSGSKSFRFDKVGVSQIFCNIHPEMRGLVVVLPNPAFSITDRDGRFRIDGIRAGKWTVAVWNPRAAPQQRAVDFTAGDVATLDLTLDANVKLANHRDKWGGEYDRWRRDGGYSQWR